MLPLAASERENGHRLIRDGDLVIVYENHKCMKAVTVSKNGEFQNRFGLFQHDDWIGKPFGCRVESKKGRFVHLLAPTPQLWTLVLTHRTQILYIADISFVLAYLEVRPGCVVLESGTGSGSLTTALGRAVAPTGHVYSFDFHEQRADAARKDFERNGLGGLITVRVRDIQGEGFPPEFSGEVDAIFLDLPQPWTAIPSVINLLRADAPVCSFSPCLEQVQKTCAALTRREFRDLRTFEVLLRTFEVHEESFGTTFGSGGIVAPSNTSPTRKRKYFQAGKDGDGHSSQDKRSSLTGDKGEGLVSQVLRSNDLSVSLPVKDSEGSGPLRPPVSETVGRSENLEVQEASFGTSFDSGGKVDLSNNSTPCKRKCSLTHKDKDGDGESSLDKCSSVTREGSEVLASRPEDSAVILPSKEPEGLKKSEVPSLEALGKKENTLKKFSKKIRYREELTECRSMIVARPEPEMKGHTGYLTFARRTV